MMKLPHSVNQSTQKELLLAIGELYVSRGKILEEYERAMAQIDEMARVIDTLRKELAYGKLEQSAHHD